MWFLSVFVFFLFCVHHTYWICLCVVFSCIGETFFACLHHFLPGGHLHAGGLWVTGAQYVSNDRFFPRPPLWHFSACIFSQLLLSCHLQNHSFIVYSSTLLLFYFDSLVSCFFLFLIIFCLLFSLFFTPISWDWLLRQADLNPCSLSTHFGVIDSTTVPA